MTHSESINELAAALSKAQAVIEGAAKDKVNPHFKAKYADLSAVWEACRKPLTDNGLSVAQTAGTTEGGLVRITTMLMHTSGQWMRDDLLLKPMKDDPQGFGSCITYGRRFSLAAIAGVAPEDDDGNAASQPQRETPKFKPVGYDEWATALEKTLAESGADAAREDFKAAKEEYRDYFTNTDKARYEKFKAASKAKAA